ncbi:HAD family hydrolase [Jatrophihabitans fulvus]
MIRPVDAQTLIFDADDTLWENNVFFERVVDDYVEWLAHPTLDPRQVRAIIADVEEANIVAHGYGSKVFLRSLRDAFTRLTERPLGPADAARIERFGEVFAAGHVELLPEVASVLDRLGSRHRLQLMTKGVPEEQQRKIDVSGLADRFAAIDIVPVKEPDTYRELVATHDLDAERTWMIGNSPRSDIVASRAAGLNAVYVPHPNTWAHEFAELDPDDDRILHVPSLADLPRHF